MKFGTLYHANFALLDKAISDWDDTLSALETLERDARRGLKAKADNANWSGVNSQVSKKFIRSTVREFADAHTEATSIRNILRDTRNDLIAQRGALHRLVDSADNYELVVQGFDDGSYQVAHKTTLGPVDQETRSTRQGKAEEISKEIQTILREAAEIDSGAATALRLLMDQAKYGFSDARYASRDEAARAVNDADKAADLARIKDPSAAQLREISHFLATHKNDDLFADRFASRLGAQATLQFWTDVTSNHDNPQGEELKQLQKLQESLSVTLSTASVSDSAGMTRWKSEAIHSGSEVFQSPGASPADTGGPRGYQVMASLLGKGRYDTEFLTDFSKSVIDFEHPSPSAAEVWRSSPGSDFDLHFGKADGRDPMTGVLQALASNHEASTEVFSSKDRLDHILDTTTQSEERGLHAGHALNAAVTGVDYTTGVVLPGMPHSDQQLNIMKDVIAYYVRPGDDIHAAQPPMAESLGNMAAAYMPEINRVISGTGSETLYPTSGGDPLTIPKENVVRFLADLAENKDSNAAVLMGSSMYSGGMLDMHMADPDLYGGPTRDAIRAITHNSGTIEGIMAHSRAGMEIAEGEKYDKEYNDSLKQRGDLWKTLVSTGAALGPEVVLGGTPMASAAGATGLAFVGGIAGIAIDKYVSDNSLDNIDEYIYGASHDLNESEDAGKRQHQLTAEHAAKERGYDIRTDDLNNLVRESFAAGWRDSDTLLEDNRK